jgi:exonuclease III
MTQNLRKWRLRKKPRHLRFKIASWNILGKLSTAINQEVLDQDLTDHQIHIAALQETKWTQEKTIRTKGGLIINLETTDAHKGLGFYLNEEWSKYEYSVRSVSPRIAVIRFKTSPYGKITIINCYSPTMKATRDGDHTEIDAFYTTLEDTVMQERSKARITIVAGDFNAKIGQREDHEHQHIGPHTIGKRNVHGQKLAEFATSMDFTISNSLFNHRTSHLATWRTQYDHPRKKIRIANQIDFILIPRNLKHIICDSIAYQNVTYSSDHSLLITSLYFTTDAQRHRRNSKSKINSSIGKRRRTYDFQQVSIDKTCHDAFHSEVEHRFHNYVAINEFMPRSLSERSDALAQILIDSANTTIPSATPTYTSNRYLNNTEVKELVLSISKRKRKLRLIKNPERLEVTKAALKMERKALRKKLDDLRMANINRIANQIESQTSNAKRMFASSRALSTINRQNFYLLDDDGANISNSNHAANIIKNIYEPIFNNPNVTSVQPWQDATPTPLNVPICSDEVCSAVQRLRNGRAPGPDNINAELLKLSPTFIFHEIANQLNEVFSCKSHMPCILHGHLFPLNKPNKPKRPSNTRPIILLNTRRKILSNILLARCSSAVEKYISLNQHAYRERRNTGEIVWSMQYLRATTQRFMERFHINSIDMSKAFDSLDRQILLNIFESEKLADNDSLRILRYLISEINLQVKVKDILSENFTSTIGSPQGDALSATAFTVYLEYALRNAKEENPQLYQHIFLNPIYADDINFAYTSSIDTNRNEFFEQDVIALSTSLQKFNLHINAEKTVHVNIDRNNSEDVTFSILGNDLNPTEELQKRLNKANQAFRCMFKAWIAKGNITLKTKLRLYNAIVIPHFLYNSDAATYKQKHIERINSAHRRHLRVLLNISYPSTIPNDKLYERTFSHAISIDIVNSRWNTLGKLLRRENTPVMTAMNHFYKTSKMRRKYIAGPFLSALPYQLNKEYKTYLTDELKLSYNLHQISTEAEFQRLKTIANNPSSWNVLNETITRSATSKFFEKEIQKHDKRKAQRANTNSNGT